MSDEKERLAWIEAAGIENMKAHHACADYLAKEASTTLTLTLAGMGGGLAYAAKAIDVHNWTWFSVGAAAFTAWMLIVSGYITLRCLRVAAIDQVYNEPKNLEKTGETFEYLRRCELLSLQQRIDRASARNAEFAKRLNRARICAIASPLALILSSVAWVAFRHFSGVA
ncbi:TPA: hypothetical protein QDB28_002161 [Burkholderia vietnamiensis]|nr:hypothetical protein [Burkholderia vietnamiensis]